MKNQKRKKPVIAGCRRKRVKLKIPIDRDIVKHVLKSHDTTETALCGWLDMSLQRYMERFRANQWDYQATYALCYVLSVLSTSTITPQELCGYKDEQ